MSLSLADLLLASPLAAWTPGATLWLRDMVIATQRLGRWNSGQQCGAWENHPEWTPEESDPAHT